MGGCYISPYGTGFAEEADPSFDCKGKGVGLRKVMYGGPSRGGVPSSIGRSGATIRWINRQAGSWKPKPKCPPN